MTTVMDINDLRSIFTTVSFLIFVGIVVWAWSKRNRADFEEAARLPFEDDQSAARTRETS